MKKNLSIIVVGILILSGVVAVGSNIDKNDDSIKELKTSKISMVFSPLTIEENKGYFEISYEDTSTYLMSPGEPVLPKVVKIFELPFGALNVNVEVTPVNIQEQFISGEIRPGPAHLPLVTLECDVVVKSERNEEVYGSSELFPDSWYTFRVGCGLNSLMERVTFVSVPVFPVRYIPAEGKLLVAEGVDVRVTYEDPAIVFSPFDVEHDLVIIAPSKFSSELKRLVDHKNSEKIGVKTILKTTEDIYEEYSGVDKPEKIKYFIKNAIDEWNIKYVLLVGGLKSLIWAEPREHMNYGARDWYVPVRYNNLFDDPEHPLEAVGVHDPGVITDLYYADIYGEGNVFQDWDTNDDGVFAAWSRPGYENDEDIDMMPDVSVGRLACRNTREVKAVVDKIISYESSPAHSSWFKKAISISGDGFLDQEDLDIQWDTNDLPDGEYTIYGRSENDLGTKGPIDVVHVTIDSNAKSKITHKHDDHLKTSTYQFDPIMEITTPSEDNILGKTDIFKIPNEGDAYCNSFNGWANINFTDGIMHIRGKSYDPRPYGNLTHVHIWIENSDYETVFDEWKYDTEMYFEGEWVAGDRELKGGGGALYYLPEDYERELLWASNGKMTNQNDVLNALSKGCGFVFMSGHGSPNTWGDHYPGVPGDRRNGSFTGLKVIGVQPWPKYVSFPILPMNTISNTDKLPVVLIGGCHNSQFNVSMIPSLFDLRNKNYLWTHGVPVPECFSWYLCKIPRRGAIATIGNTGLGYGILGKDCLIGGLDGGICIMFFKQYGKYGHQILGDAYLQTQNEYFNTMDMEEDDHIKSLQQWVLLGDPSLMLGGYS